MWYALLLNSSSCATLVELTAKRSEQVLSLQWDCMPESHEKEKKMMMMKNRWPETNKRL